MKTKTKPFSFPNITIENVPYPTVILGEDSFTGWFGKGNYPNEPTREAVYEEVLDSAYRLGVRGFSMSPHSTLSKVLRKVKAKHPDIVVIANPHWQSHYFVGNESLWTPLNRGRLLATAAARLAGFIRAASPLFREAKLPSRFSDEEISRFRLDEDEFRNKLAFFGEFANFVIVGNLPFGSMLYTGREDIIRREISLVRAAGMIPIGISEGGDHAFQKLKMLDVAGMWVWANRTGRFPAPANLAGLLTESLLPFTAFRIFEHDGGFDIQASLAFIRSIGRFCSIVVGVDDKSQAEETFSQIRTLFRD